MRVEFERVHVGDIRLDDDNVRVMMAREWNLEGIWRIGASLKRAAGDGVVDGRPNTKIIDVNLVFDELERSLAHLDTTFQECLTDVGTEGKALEASLLPQQMPLFNEASNICALTGSKHQSTTKRQT